MLALARFSTSVCSLFQRAGAQLLGSSSTFHSLAVETSSKPNPGGLFSIAVRYNIRNHFPRPCERKRIRKHGWAKRMSVPGGQRILMRRILKGKHVYSH